MSPTSPISLMSPTTPTTPTTPMTLTIPTIPTTPTTPTSPTISSHRIGHRARLPLALLCSLALAVGSAYAQNVQRGAELAKPCAACHGVDGNSIAPAFPRLAGQHQDYLLHSLRSYRTGARKNAIMSGQIGTLTDQDFRDLAAYYAQMKGMLSVIR